MSTRMSSKGQIVLPKTVRDTHKWKTGAEFVIEEAGDGIILRPAKSFVPPSPSSRRRDLMMCLAAQATMARPNPSPRWMRR